MTAASMDTLQLVHPASYVVGLLTDVCLGDELVEYLTRIDETLTPYGGSFLIHGGSPKAVEGSIDADLIVIGFPAPDGAERWYHSSAYQELAVLRQRFSDGSVVLYTGEGPTHRAIDILSDLSSEQGP